MIFSISILAYNRPGITERCLASVFKSIADYDAGVAQVIITDNGCSMETADLLQIFAEATPSSATLIQHHHNLGVIKAKNQALDAAAGEFFVSLDNDCTVSEGWLERLREPFLRDPKMGQTGRKGGFRSLSRDGVGVRGAGVDYVDGSCFMVRADLARELVLCDPVYEFAYCEDSDFSLRLRKAGWMIELVGAGVGHREHATAGKMNLGKIWNKNHRTFINRWRGYLRTRSFGHPGEP